MATCPGRAFETPAAAMAEDANAVASSVSARVPCAAGARLTFSWGLGTELRLCEVQDPRSGQGGRDPFKSTVIWWVHYHAISPRAVAGTMQPSAWAACHGTHPQVIIVITITITISSSSCHSLSCDACGGLFPCCRCLSLLTHLLDWAACRSAPSASHKALAYAVSPAQQRLVQSHAAQGTTEGGDMRGWRVAGVMADKRGCKALLKEGYRALHSAHSCTSQDAISCHLAPVVA